MPLLKTTPEGDALLTTFITTSIVPSSEAFKQGNDEEGVRRFVNGVLGEGSYEKLPPPVQKRVMDNVQELKGRDLIARPLPAHHMRGCAEGESANIAPRRGAQS